MEKYGMKPKTIDSVITKKINALIKSVEDEKLANKMKDDIIVSGGSIVSMLLGEEVNDFDVYFRTYDTAREVALHYINIFNKKFNTERVKLFDETNSDQFLIYIKSEGVAGNKEEVNSLQRQEIINEKQKETKKKEEFKPVFFTNNAITLSDDVQLILRFYGEPEEIHKNYDFVHCINYWTYDEGLVLKKEALQSMLSKSLVYQGSYYPVCSLFRIRKFLDRGWRINAGQILKIALQISKLNLLNFDTFSDQCIGVDTAYFQNIINRIDTNGKIDEDNNLNEGYLLELINELFGEE